MSTLLTIGCGGFLGAISRYLVSGWIYTIFGTGMPYGTLTVNIVGSFLLGIVAQLMIAGNFLTTTTSSFLSIGFLGAFTTFSTFSVQTLELLESGNPTKALLNILLNLILCLIGAWGGLFIGRFFS